jgi:hydrogenase maturation protease
MTDLMSRRVLVAGVGNIFFGDDGFGSEVARVLLTRDLAEGVRVVDYGIRGTHLAYDLLDGWASLIVIDAVPPAGEPGRVSVMEVDEDRLGGAEFDPHAMDPRAVLSTLASLGGSLPPTYVVGCEPRVLREEIGLSKEVTAAIPDAVAAVESLVSDLIREE